MKKEKENKNEKKGLFEKVIEVPANFAGKIVEKHFDKPKKKK